MTPYGRFQIVTGAISGALVLGVFGWLASKQLNGPLDLNAGLSFAGLTAAAITIWYTLNHHMMPLFFQHPIIRNQVLGHQNIEGTWLQAERSEEGMRIAILGIRPAKDGFTLSGYALDDNLEVVSNLALEYSKLEWPQMSFKFRNTMVDAENPAREGFGELQFELGNARPLRYNGFCKQSNAQSRYAIEGLRLTNADDLDQLQTLEGREELVDKYWELFFERDQRRAERKAERMAQRDRRRIARSRPKIDTTESQEPDYRDYGPAAQLKSQVDAAFSNDATKQAASRRRAG